MSLDEIVKRGFRIVQQRNAPIDNNGIDGILILRKLDAKRNHMVTGQKAQKLFISAHYAKNGHYGEPVPIPGI